MNAALRILAVLFVGSSTVSAGTRTSANYSAIDVVDAGGSGAAGSGYTNTASIGQISGNSISSVAPQGNSKSGFLGQLYDLTPAVAISATANSIDEEGTLQLTAVRVLDDQSFLAIANASAAWTVQSGPLASINNEGLATAAIVYQNTAAVARMDLDGKQATFALTVLDSAKDNFGDYAGDSITDSWQIQYFGQSNSQAAPGIDADEDGQTNLTEFRAGYIPTDVTSRLVTRAVGVSGSNFLFELSRVQPGTKYIFERSIDLTTWSDVFTLTPSAAVEPFTQPLATAGRKGFYRVRLEAP